MALSRVMATFAAAMLALFHCVCSQSVEDLGIPVADLVEEDVCATGAGDDGDCSLHLLQLRGEQHREEVAEGTRDRALLSALMARMGSQSTGEASKLDQTASWKHHYHYHHHHYHHDHHHYLAQGSGAGAEGVAREVSAEEAVAVERALSGLDANGDGELQLEEVSGLVHGMGERSRARVVGLFRSQDKDGSQGLNTAEVLGALDALLQVEGQAKEARDANKGEDAQEAVKVAADAEAEDPDEESVKGPDVAVLSEMSASERAALMGTTERGGRIDMIWPGSAYAGVLDGGIWQAAKFDHGYTIDSILGSSGGAASAFLCLVDEAHGTDRSLTTYKSVYNKYKQAKASGLTGWSTTAGCTTDNKDDDACWWYYNYKQVLDSSAFANVRSKLKISMYCKKTKLTVLYNFQSTEQVAQALAAAGNGGLGYFKVDSLNDWCYDYDTSAQGYGFPSKFNPQSLPVYYYNNGPLTSASSVFCPDWTSIALGGYKCVDYAISLGRKHWANTNYLWRPGAYSSISNNFWYSFGPATWLAR